MKRNLIPLLALAIACGPGERDDVDLAIQNVTGTLQSVLLLAQLAEIAFEVDPNLATTPIADAGPIATADLVTQIGTLSDLLGCPEAPEITTDDATFVEVTIDCVSASFNAGLRGTLHLEVAFEGTPCGNDTCVAAVNWRLTSGSESPFAYLAGESQIMFTDPADLRFPVGDAERSLRSPRVDVVNRSGSAADVDARWTAQPCITMDLDVIMTQVPGLEDPALDSVYPIVFSADAVRVCLGRCPASGTVQLSYALGTILEWEYGTGQVVRVFGPRGRSREATLDCES